MSPVSIRRRVFLRALVPAPLLAFCPRLAHSQEYNPGYELGNKTYLTLSSSVLKEQRTVELILPPGFEADSQDPCDPIYILDGIRAYHYVAYDYLRGEGFIPKRTILVGLLGLKDTPTRYRDFTPTRVSGDSGGADRYLEFLRNELVPLINKNYNTSSERSALVGGSMGGLFVIHAMLNAPSLFKSYVALDPSMWWDNGEENAVVERNISRLKDLRRALWINAREGEGMHEMMIDRLQTTLRTRAPSGFTWACRPYENETHLTTWVKGFWDGIKFCYGGYYPGGIGFKPANGIVVKDEPFPLWCYQREAATYIRYTLDGSEPTLQSARLSPENRFSLSKDTRLNIKAFCAREVYNATASGTFKIGSAIVGAELPKGAQPGGLRFAYYEGDWERPGVDVSRLKPDRTGRADREFDLEKLPDNRSFICVLDGFLKVDHDGYYIIELGDEGYSKVFLGDMQVIGDHFDSNGANFMVPLKKGFHPFRVAYFHRKGGRALAPVYIKPGGHDGVPIPLDQLYSRIE
jgi:predicted alpha/beta superfamily hydrolase